MTNTTPIISTKCIRIDLSGSALEQIPESLWQSLQLRAAKYITNTHQSTRASTGDCKEEDEFNKSNNVQCCEIQNLVDHNYCTNIVEIDLGYNQLSNDFALQPLLLGKKSEDFLLNQVDCSLRLTANRIQVFPKCLLELKTLVKLDLCDNNISYIPEEITQLEK